jgi:parallel beta-helix repeat protein
MKKMISLCFILTLMTQSPALTATRLVPKEYASIQAAIDDCNDGDTVIVSPGTYIENINFNGRNIVLTSTKPDDPEIVATTVLQSQPFTPPARGQTTNSNGSVITFENGETSEAVLTGFTITGGYGTKNDVLGEEIIWGGGIFCFNASPTIKNNVITNNDTTIRNQGIEDYGGGIGCFGSSPIITYNIIKYNSAYAGAGLLTFFGDPVIINNLIYDNTAVAGGGFAMLGGQLINNTITGNSADVGGNGYLISSPDEAYYTVKSNIISSARRGEGLYRQSFYQQDCIAFNNIWNNAGGGDVIWNKDNNSDGNISLDPMFVDPQNNDYHLQINSPCINAGDMDYSPAPGETDIYGNSRMIHGRVDIGAAEFDGNLRPVADAGQDQSITAIPDVIRLDGSGSYDPDGNQNLTYRWAEVAGTSVTLKDAETAMPTFSPSGYGVYIFELVISDGIIDSLPDRVCIVIDNGYIPVADAGLPVYSIGETVTLDGTKSYDPDSSGDLLYYWQQVSGPPVVMTDSNTPVPSISGFIQTNLLQICEFQLVVYDGQYESLPDTVELRIVPTFGSNIMRLENTSYDPDKPTVIFFGGGDCVNGSGTWNSNAWEEKANIISFNYGPDNSSSGTYQRTGDMIIHYLFTMAPNYCQPIQTMGHSTGGQPTIDAAIRMNLTYKDARYAVNRVTFLDGRCRDYSPTILDYLSSSVDGEQCWIDSYESAINFYPGIMNVNVSNGDHGAPPRYYKDSLTNPQMNEYNGGLVAGSYWSVIGPGKNLQLALTPDREIYRFRAYDAISPNYGYVEFYDEPNFPAKLPEPVTLLRPIDIGDPNGPVLTCMESENAVGYQLLLGRDPLRVMDFQIISDTPAPPNEVITSVPYEQTWWTVRVYDQYGSTIYADPIPISALNLSFPVENQTTGKRYCYLQDAIDEAEAGDEIVAKEGLYYESIDFKGKSLILRSINPDDPAVVKATVFRGDSKNEVVTFSGGEDANCILAGSTINGGKNGIYCSQASPTITNCNISANSAAGIYLYRGSNPVITHCRINNNSGSGIEMVPYLGGRLKQYNHPVITHCVIAANGKHGITGDYPTITNNTICDNTESGINDSTSTITNSIIYFNGDGTLTTQLPVELSTVTYSDIQGFATNDGNIDADPLFADPVNGDYHLKSQAGRWDPASQMWVQDQVNSPCIDGGDPNSTVGLEPEPNGSVINMGAYGGTDQASKSEDID